jgi:sugar-specific transcriptional regulator TrmB
MLNKTDLLKELGLSDKEVTVFTASLQHGQQTSNVIAKKTNLARSTVGFIFEELIKKGFASKQTKNNSTFYSAINPKHLEHLVLDKIGNAKKLYSDFKETLPFLLSLQNKFSSVPKVRYFEGVEGLCRMLDDFCEKDQTVLYISGHNMMHPKIRKYTYETYLPISNKHINKNKIILNDGKLSREYSKIAKKAYDEFIFVDDKKCRFTLTTAIYGNKVAFWSYDPSDMSGVIIENHLIADNMRNIFGVLKTSFLRN